MLRSTAGLLLLLVAAAVTTVHGQQGRHDGNWWSTRAALEKTVYLSGVWDGIALGAMMSKPVVQTRNGRLDENQLRENDAIEQRIQERAGRYIDAVTIGQLSDGLDAFYRDFRNRSIFVYMAVDVVLKQIAGENVDSQIASLRRLSASSQR